MNVRWREMVTALCFLVPGLARVDYAQDRPAISKTPLDEYIARPEPIYAWQVAKTIPGDGFTTLVLDLKSQTWRTTTDLYRTVWQHWLVVVKPHEVRHDIAQLRIGGGRNSNQPPDKPNPQIAEIALRTHSVVAELGQIPNQPLVFDGDGKERVEDDLIAYCWIKYMDSGDPTWLPRLPMVKSAMRAMDAITELMASEKGGKKTINKFVVAGGSKRGWTTWLTGAADHRVVAIVPAVIDVLNMRESIMHHFAAYGFWAPAIGDYTQHKIHERMDTPEYAKLLQIVDPYSYRDRLTMPKFVVNAAGDQYFLPDSSRYYFSDLKGPKYLRYVPNADHSLRGSDAMESIFAFYDAILRGAELPKFTWKLQKDGSIEIRSETKPLEVNLWQATNPNARDFRLDSIGQAYQKSSLPSQGDGVYVARVGQPTKGWTAFFAELVFESGGGFPFKCTTDVSVVPDELPYSFDEFRKSIKE